MARNGNGDGEHTLRVLREIRAEMAEMRADMTNGFARLEKRMDGSDKRLDSVEKRLAERIDVLGRIVKDNHRLFSKRLRTVEIRLSARGR